RVTDGDRRDPAQFVDVPDEVVVQVGHAVPQHVAGRRRHDECTLADRESFAGSDAVHAWRLLAGLHRVAVLAQLPQARPLLAGRRHVLAFVLADRTVATGARVLGPTGDTQRQVGAHGSSVAETERRLSAKTARDDET